MPFFGILDSECCSHPLLGLELVVSIAVFILQENSYVAHLRCADFSSADIFPMQLNVEYGTTKHK